MAAGKEGKRKGALNPTLVWETLGMKGQGSPNSVQGWKGWG